MFTAADIEAEYLDILSSLTPRQIWAMQIYGTSCALVAAERGSAMGGSPDEQAVARELLFDAEAVQRNAKGQAPDLRTHAPASERQARTAQRH